MIKVSDYIVKRLVEYGVTDVFMITGGGSMHLNDSVGRNESINYICNHHEQASAIAAEGYSRVTGKLAVVIVTSGPGGTNTITGVIGQWLDSIPVLYISGQVKRETTIASCPHIPLRQLGDQEINIVDIVKSVTKFAQQIVDPKDTKRLLDEAIDKATSGRPGPVWLDVPLDVQGAQVREDDMPEYTQSQELHFMAESDLQEKVRKTVDLLKTARRPVIIAGHGIRISGARELFLNIKNRLGIPVVSTINGFDLIGSDDSDFVGRIGTIADRAGNFAVQNCDLLLSIGSRNNIRQISYNYLQFAREAQKISVDIDKAELDKTTFKPDIVIHADAKYFLEEFHRQIEQEILPQYLEWKEWCIFRKHKYPVVLPEYAGLDHLVNPYYFMQILSQCMSDKAVTVAGNGTAFLAMFQAGQVKDGQRYIWNSGCASMGYDLPAAIGACYAAKGKDVVCLAGDGSVQMNIQELQTVVHHNLPIKLFVLNNDGYISIKQTQDNFFGGKRVGCNSTTGVSFPDVGKLASAYGLPVHIIDGQKDLVTRITDILGTPGPSVSVVELQNDYKFSPRNSSEQKANGILVSKPLEDLYPFLDREELRSNMIIPIIEE